MVVTRLYFEIPPTTESASFSIDLARELSKHHRRLIRQKQVFTVYGGIYQDSDDSNLYISTAPNYWVTKRAINRTFKAWKKQLSDTMSSRGGVDDGSQNQLRTGKWSDFKLLLDSRSSTSSHPTPATGGYLQACDAHGEALPSGEWNYTTLTRPRPDIDQGGGSYETVESDQFDLQIVGPHTSTTEQNGTTNYNRVGVIQSWLDSRPTPNDSIDTPDHNPDMITDPIHQMFAVGDADEDEMIVYAINEENDFPPYDLDLLYGAHSSNAGHGENLQMQAIVCPDSNTGVSAVPGFQAICGLVRLHVAGGTGATGAALVLDVESNGVGF